MSETNEDQVQRLMREKRELFGMLAGSYPAHPVPFPAEDAERERLARLIEEEAFSRIIATPGVRIGLAIAASIVRRGRRLTEDEQFENLIAALAEVDEEEPKDADQASGPTTSQRGA